MLLLLRRVFGGFGPWFGDGSEARRNMLDTRDTLFRWCFWGLNTCASSIWTCADAS